MGVIFVKLHTFFSLFSENGSEDETPFSSLQRHSSRDVDEPFRLHRLRSSRPTRSSVEKGDSGSGSEEEEEDDDGFELLTAENLFSTLLSRVRMSSSYFFTRHHGILEWGRQNEKGNHSFLVFFPQKYEWKQNSEEIFNFFF